MGKNCICECKDSIKYEFIKCKKCGKTIKDFSDGLKKNWKLKIIYSTKNGDILIRGNKIGLEYLASCCLAIIDKNNPAGHIHLEWQMNNLMEGSTRTLLEYSDQPDDYKDDNS